jgi:hypothetical protein
VSKRLFRCFAFFLLAAPGVILLVGCNRGPAVAQVSGKVLYKDGSVPKGGVRIVRFEPSDDSPAEIRRPAGGAIADDGTFVLSTRKPGDGIYLGKYAVTFTVIKAPREQISLIKPEYTRAASTPYHVTIDGDRDDLMFEIEPLQ